MNRRAVRKLQQKTEQDADDAVLLSEGAMEDGVYEGIVVDASMNNFAIRTEDGVTSFMERPEQGGTLKDGLLLGIPVKVVIEGQAVTELTDGGKAAAVRAGGVKFCGQRHGRVPV